jgi:tetratricopeptide (TPR) repeat protein
VEAAETACGQWPEYHQSWNERARARFEYGATLKATGEQDRALEIWADGYATPDRLTSGSPGFDFYQMTVLKRSRLQLAYHLGLLHTDAGRVKEAAPWFLAVIELGDYLRSARPADRLVLYCAGVSRVNLAEAAGVTGPAAAAELPRLREGLDALERCLAERPTEDDPGADVPYSTLATDLGYSWELYARGLSAAGDRRGARAAAGVAVRRQWRAFIARPDAERARRLFSHAALLFELTCRGKR